MKTFIVLLILSNVAYFGWNQGWLRDVPPEPVSVVFPQPETRLPPFEQAPESLTLLSELPGDQQPDPGESAGGQAEDLRQGSSGEALGQLEGVRGEADDLASAESTTPGLVTESDFGVVAAPDPWCGELGLFEQESAARDLLPALDAMGFKASLESGTVPVSSTFWVHLPPFDSRAEAFARLEELQDAGIDSYYMRTGSMAGGISMGVFSRLESAEQAQRQFARRGYETEIGEVFREEARWWLALRTEDSARLEAASWLAFRAEHSQLLVTENVCEVVASAPQFP